MKSAKIAAIIFIPIIITLFIAPGLDAAGINGIKWENLSDKDISPQAKLALSIEPEKWQHAETPHFIYHFMDDKKAELVYTHAEVYYRWIKELFGVDEDSWKKKSHIFVFTDKPLWDDFTSRAKPNSKMEAFTTGWELFIYMNPYWLSPIKSLSHEITHIIIFRFLDGPIPLFLNEGIAEFIGYKAAALKADGDEYRIRTISLIPEKDFIPVERLIEITSYPDSNIEVFYRESELAVRFLITNYDGKKFYALLRTVSRGEPFKRALEEIYSMEFETFCDAFTKYAVMKKGND